MSYIFKELNSLILLTKPRVIFLIVFTAIIGMLLSSPNIPSLSLLIYSFIGIWMISSSAAVFNCIIERDFDSKMKRTKNRPLVKNEVKLLNALIFGVIICLSGMIILYFFVNTLTLLLTFFTFVGYTILYTVVLKHLTPQNIVIGGASGAMPPVLGWTAIQNGITFEPLVLFLIIFIWTPPHFWALALYRKDDYEKTGIPMLPVTHGSDFTKLHLFLYTLLLFIVSLLPFLTGMNSYLYLISAIFLGLNFIYKAYDLLKYYNDVKSRSLFKYSIYYLSILFLALLIDHYLF